MRVNHNSVLDAKHPCLNTMRKKEAISVATHKLAYFKVLHAALQCEKKPGSHKKISMIVFIM